ncbi:hypothetical protein [Lacticaseibacillus brantae]|nr:hypothetical protein [Lacticaseibacillus brantae]
MLVKYKRDYQKIAMGFLSFLPDLDNLSNLKTELNLYTEDNDHALFMYREAPTADFSGVVGIEASGDSILVRHLSFSPSVRSRATEFQALDDLKQLYPEATLMGTLETAHLVVDWQRERKEQASGSDTEA